MVLTVILFPYWRLIRTTIIPFQDAQLPEIGASCLNRYGYWCPITAVTGTGSNPGNLVEGDYTSGATEIHVVSSRYFTKQYY